MGWPSANAINRRLYGTITRIPSDKTLLSMMDVSAMLSEKASNALRMDKGEPLWITKALRALIHSKINEEVHDIHRRVKAKI